MAPGEWGNERAAQLPLEPIWAVAADIPCARCARFLSSSRWTTRTFSIFRRTRIHTAIRRGQTLLRKTTIRKRQWNRSLLFFTIFYYQSFCYILLFRPYSCQRPPSASGASLSHGAAAQPAEPPRSARHFVLFNRRLTANPASLAPAQLLSSRTLARSEVVEKSTPHAPSLSFAETLRNRKQGIP
jgi:hypothetical protein